jgi:hypothetical protein
MFLVLLGLVVLVITGAVFWLLLPRGERLHRWANTELEPYIAVAICAGVAIGFSMTLAGIFNLYS